MMQLESRNLLSIGLTILDGVDGFPVGARISGDEADDVIAAFYDPVARQVTVNPLGECLVMGVDESVRILIDGGGGNDSISVRGGKGAVQFIVVGGPGDDTITGSNGHDWIEGGEGDDWIAGSVGRDYLAGGVGNDSLFGARGDDALFGGDGADELWGGGGWDTLYPDAFDAVTLGEERPSLADATPANVVIDPNEIVTPPCPPDCPPGWEEAG